jgi:hypothetical protein
MNRISTNLITKKRTVVIIATINMFSIMG